jgi:hypothetical protein
MANNNRVGSRTPLAFGYYKLGEATANLATIANAVANIAILSGGVGANGGYIIRGITAIDLVSGDAHGANVFISTSSDGNTSNAVTTVANTAGLMTGLTANNTYWNLTLNTAANSNVQTASCLFVNVITANSNGTLIQFNVNGDLINP